MSAERPAPPRRRRSSVILLRRVEVDSPVHRLWAGTKLLAVAAVSLTVSYAPSWPSLGVLAALIVAAFVAARLPRSVLPRLPWWVWGGLAVGAALTFISGGKPLVHVAGARLGLGGLDSYVLFVLFSFELLGAAALVGWTTNLGDVGPSVRSILRPLRRLRLPIDEWAVAIALCIRCLPLLVDEARTLWAAHRLRPRHSRRDLRRLAGELVEVIFTALAVSLRRAGEMAEAMTARGGPGAVTARVRPPGRSDVVAAAVVVAVCAAAFALPGGVPT